MLMTVICLINFNFIVSTIFIFCVFSSKKDRAEKNVFSNNSKQQPCSSPEKTKTHGTTQKSSTPRNNSKVLKKSTGGRKLKNMKSLTKSKGSKRSPFEDMEEPSAAREASAKEEKPVIEQTKTFSWNSRKRREASASVDDFDRSIPLAEMTATDMYISSTQVESAQTKPSRGNTTVTVTLGTSTVKEKKEMKKAATKIPEILKSQKTQPSQTLSKKSSKRIKKNINTKKQQQQQQSPTTPPVATKSRKAMKKKDEMMTQSMETKETTETAASIKSNRKLKKV